MFSLGGDDGGDDAYAFDVDFSKKPKFNKRQSAVKTTEPESDEDDDPAKGFRADYNKSRRASASSSTSRRGSASALDRASAYLTKYKKPSGQASTVKLDQEMSPTKSPDSSGLDFNAFMNDSDSDDSPKSRRRSSDRDRRAARRQQRSGASTSSPDFGSNLVKQSEVSPVKVERRQRAPSYSLGNTLKGKLSSPEMGVVKSGSDINDIVYKPPPEPSPARTEASEIGESADDIEVEEEVSADRSAFGNVRGFDELDDVAGTPEHLGKVRSFEDLIVEEETSKVKQVSFVETKTQNESVASAGSYGDGSFEEDEPSPAKASVGSSLSRSARGGDLPPLSPKDIEPVMDEPKASHGNVLSFDMLDAVVADPAPSPLSMPKPIPAPAPVTVTITKAIAETTTSPASAPKTRDVGTQFTGNSAAVQVDLAPEGMYGTRSGLDARFTVEAADVARTDARPETKQPLFNNFVSEEKVVVEGAADAYLKLLLEARADADRLRSELDARGWKTYVGRSTVADVYDKERTPPGRRAAAQPAAGGGLDTSRATNASSADGGDDSAGSLELSASASGGESPGLDGLKATTKSSLFGTKVLDHETAKFAMGETGASMRTGPTPDPFDALLGNQTDPNLQLLAAQSLFRKQLESVRRGVASAKIGYEQATSMYSTLGHGRSRRNNVSSSSTNRSYKMSESGTKKESGSKKKSGRRTRRKKKENSGPETIAYWEALMKVDPSLTTTEAKRIAKNV